MPKKHKIYSPIKSLVRDKVSIQNKKKLKSKLIVSFVLFIAILFILTSIYFAYQFISIQPIRSISSESVNRLLVQKDSVETTLVVIEANEPFKIQGAWYIIDNKRNSGGFVYYIPPGIYMRDYLNKVGEYISTGELKYVGDSISNQRAVEYSIWQLNNLTGIVPDSYIWVTYESLKHYSNLYSDISDYSLDQFKDIYINKDNLSIQAYTINSYFSKVNFLTNILNIDEYREYIGKLDTNLSHLQLLDRIKNVKTALQKPGMYMLDLTQPWATNVQLASNGREVSVINYLEVDSRLENVVLNLKGREIEKEQVKVEIFNASDITGLAGRYYRKFENSGLEVVRYENAPNQIDKTTVYIPNINRYKNSFELLKKLIVVDIDIVEGRPDFMTTGDIIVILGKDMKTEALWQ